MQNEPNYLGLPSMTSFRQIDANRRNARKSTGPTTQEGKQRSRCNAVRHGLTAETVIGALEKMRKITRRSTRPSLRTTMPSRPWSELVLRLASLLWRLRRATTMETGLFQIQADHLSGLNQPTQVRPGRRAVIHALFGRADSASFDPDPALHGSASETEDVPGSIRKMRQNCSQSYQ